MESIKIPADLKDWRTSSEVPKAAQLVIGRRPIVGEHIGVARYDAASNSFRSYPGNIEVLFTHWLPVEYTVRNSENSG